jgi:arylsulfatase A-like enzyme
MVFLAALAIAPRVSPPLKADAAGRASQPTQPNIIFILTDDMDAQSLAVMPALKALVADQGTTFTNHFVSISLCCPSRATILRGQYGHNTQIMTNNPPDGGFETVLTLGLERSTVATWLQDAGYRTVLLGKYLNGYPLRSNQRYVPPGWDEWYSATRGGYGNFDYTLNENGRLVDYGEQPGDYLTDVLARKGSDFIQRAAADRTPFFMYMATFAPHGPATPAPRHKDAFPDATAPRTPSFNEADVSDKPTWVRRHPLLTDAEIAEIDTLYRKRLQSLLAVDEMIAALVETLRATGQLENTYLFFTSDNGFHLGQHRLNSGKQTAYEEDIHVPLIVRGPGVPAGRTVDQIVGNVDFAPTWAELGGAATPMDVDGRSLVPLFNSGPPSSTDWRQAYLIEHGMPEDDGSFSTGSSLRSRRFDAPAGALEPPDPMDRAPAQAAGRIPVFQALRTKDHLYVEYDTRERELYDLRQDPYQLQNQSGTAPASLVQSLQSQLDALRGCAGAKCRAAEGAP